MNPHDRLADRREERREEHSLETASRREDLYNDDLTVFHPTRPSKILVSPGLGSGWVTWAPRQSTDAFLAWMLTYEPLIRGLERREHKEKLEELHREFHHQAHIKFGMEHIVCARVNDLVVEEVRGPFEIRETDGSERVVEVNRRSLRRNIVI